MENRNPMDKGSLWGILLIGVGALFLLQTTGILHFAWNVIVSLGFIFGGLLFLGTFLRDRRQWWALFPAVGMGLVGVTIGLGGLFPNLHLGGALFLGGIGAAFAAVFASNRGQWWAIIPAGTLLTLATVSLLEGLLPFSFGWLFFAGLSATFGFVYWETRQQWALIPSLALGGIATLTLVGSFLKFAFPLVLVAVGLYLLRRK